MNSKFYNNVKTVFFLGALSGIILLAGHLIGGRQGVIIALGIAAVTNFISYFYSDKIALMSMGAREVGPDHELYQITAQLAQRANLPMPRVYVAPSDAPNAFATGRNPQHAAVCATEGLLRILDRHEIAGVMGHELAHVKHRDILISTVAATIAAAISSLGYLAFWFGGSSRDDDEGGGNPLVALLFLIFAPIAAVLIQAAISRSREFNADNEGARLAGDPMYLASALEKLQLQSQRIPLETNPAYNSMFIVEPLNPLRSMANLFATHPPMEKRLMNLIGRQTTGMFRYAA
ncbi:MAG TPA: zinc metalloprotease HtpX [Tepidisphaeraceae bacterium]|jgi:heat shock protein HtpX